MASTTEIKAQILVAEDRLDRLEVAVTGKLDVLIDSVARIETADIDTGRRINLLEAEQRSLVKRLYYSLGAFAAVVGVIAVLVKI